MTKIIPISAYPLEVQHAEQTRYGFIPLEEMLKKYPPIQQDPDFRDETVDAKPPAWLGWALLGVVAAAIALTIWIAR